MTGYVRQSEAEIQDGEVVEADPINAEFDRLQQAFNGDQGHGHTGTTGDGPPIDLTTSVTEILPAANGGTNVGTIEEFYTEFDIIPADDFGNGTVAGTATAITLTTDRDWTVFEDGMIVVLRPTNDVPSGGATLDVNELGPKAIKKITPNGESDPSTGDIIDGGLYFLRYSAPADTGSGAWILFYTSANQTPYQVGDFFDTVRTLGPDWLRRDGTLYSISSYPALAALLPVLSDGIDFADSGNVVSTSLTIHSVINDGSQFIAAGGSGYIYRSPTGEQWEVAAQVASGTPSFQNVIFGNGVYVAADLTEGKIYVSNDTESWTPTTVLESDGLYGVCWSATNSLFITCGADGYMASSANATSWTNRTSGVSEILNMVRDFNGTVVAVGEAGSCVSSTNGTTYTVRTTSVATGLNDVTKLGSVYIIVGDNGVIKTSTNLATWTTRASGTTDDLIECFIADDIAVIVGENGTVLFSTTGTTWNFASPGTTGLFRAGCVDPGNTDRIVLIATNSPNPTQYFIGIRTSASQFRVPNDSPTYGWIKAVE